MRRCTWCWCCAMDACDAVSSPSERSSPCTCETPTQPVPTRACLSNTPPPMIPQSCALLSRVGGYYRACYQATRLQGDQATWLLGFLAGACLPNTPPPSMIHAYKSPVSRRSSCSRSSATDRQTRKRRSERRSKRREPMYMHTRRVDNTARGLLAMGVCGQIPKGSEVFSRADTHGHTHTATGKRFDSLTRSRSSGTSAAGPRVSLSIYLSIDRSE